MQKNDLVKKLGKYIFFTSQENGGEPPVPSRFGGPVKTLLNWVKNYSWTPIKPPPIKESLIKVPAK